MSKGEKDGQICPVCGKHTFKYDDYFEICPICNWQDDGFQRRHPDEDRCGNKMSLNQAREAYKKGEKVY